MKFREFFMTQHIFFSGTVINVEKLLSQLKRSEKARSDLESQLDHTRTALTELKGAAEKHAGIRDKLQVSTK